MGEGELCLVGLIDVSMENEGSSRIKLKQDHECLVEEADSDSYPNKKHAKESSIEELRSEVSNPNVSPPENISRSIDITSQAVELAFSNQVECGEVTSTCSSDSSAQESVSDGEPGGSDNDLSRLDLPSQVVLEIPKHASSSGIRKITFKFSKKDYESVAQPASTWFDSRLLTSSSDEELRSMYGNPSLCTSSVELKMSKKVVPISYPTNVRKLLSTGILDGARVKYVSDTQEKELDGIIDSGGYACGCSFCNYSKVLNAFEFEKHAGAKTRHPNNHIYLENGKPVYSITQELKTAPLCLLDEVIRNVAGSAVNEESFQVWKARIQRSNGFAEADKQYNINSCSVSHSIASYPSQAVGESIWPVAHPTYTFMPKKPERQLGFMKVTLEERKHSVKRPGSNTLNTVMQQKKTAKRGIKRRDDLHRLLFMPDGLEDGTGLAYYFKGRRLLGGYKQGNGIVCSCCNREISPSQFESHAGMAVNRQPYRHIYTSKGGMSLHDIAISIANGQNNITGASDDMCTLCGDEGNLVLCNRCPRAFHAACLGLPSIPDHGWKCSYCREKLGTGREAAAEEESSNIVRATKVKLTRVVKPRELEIGGCVVCRAHDFSADGFDDRTMMLCDQCEKEFHVGCLRNIGLCDLKELPKGNWFCCNGCSRIYFSLKSKVLEGEKLIPAPLSATIERKHKERGLVFDEAENIVNWQILSGKSRCPEDLPLLSRAVAIFRECFDPIVFGGGRDLIPLMVHGRNICGQEFGRMYCVVLTTRSIVVSAGLLRVISQEVAELPLVATSREHQGKGYFQALLSCIEMLLCSLKVQKLVLPAAEEALSIWTKKFGFRKMSQDQLAKYMREVQLTIFKGTSMLEKEVQEQAPPMRRLSR